MKTNNKNEKNLIEVKENILVRFINLIKKRWLISGINTIILIAILIAVVIVINIIVESFNITPIDCTTTKEYTLTSESKERLSNINQKVNLYFVGYTDDAATYLFAKQYNKFNNEINIEIIDLNERTDFASKYNLTNGEVAIVVESNNKSKTILSDELYTYDSNYNTINITEEKITSAILNVTSEKIAKVYFLTGYSNYNMDSSGIMNYFAMYLKDEILEYENLDILVKGTIPEDCNTLVITTPIKDFDELTTNQIINYINNGGNILWLNASYSQKVELVNVNKILELYGLNGFDVGYIYETDQNKMIQGYPSFIVEDLGNTSIDKNLNKALLINATKININEEMQNNLNVKTEKIIKTSDESYFRKDISNTSVNTENDEKGSFIVGGIFTKNISGENEEEAEKKSKLIIYGENNFISDAQISSQIPPMIMIYNNKDLVLNSIAYLTDTNEDITIRKNYSQVSSFTATDGQKSIIMKIIFIIPIIIIIFGIIVWQIRRRKK